MNCLVMNSIKNRYENGSNYWESSTYKFSCLSCVSFLKSRVFLKEKMRVFKQVYNLFNTRTLLIWLPKGLIGSLYGSFFLPSFSHVWKYGSSFMVDISWKVSSCVSICLYVWWNCLWKLLVSSIAFRDYCTVLILMCVDRTERWI